MYKIIDIPYGTYLGQVIDISDVKINDKDYVQLQIEIVYGDWHDYFNAATNAKGLSFYSGSFNLPIVNVSADSSRIRDYITNYKNKEKILIAVEIDKVRFGKENQYHNITNLYDWTLVIPYLPRLKHGLRNIGMMMYMIIPLLSMICCPMRCSMHRRDFEFFRFPLATKCHCRGLRG